MTAEERYCHEMLATLRRQYEKAAQPYIDRLVRIKSLETLVRIVPVDQVDILPKCYSSNPSEQEKAENDCGTCPHRWPCLHQIR